jgi:hypothetical protein
MDDATQARLVEAYVTRARGVSGADDDATFWAWDATHELVREEPEVAWAVIRAVLAQCNDDRMLSYVAAGPLENLMCWHGPRFIDRVEAEAAASPRFLRALGGVWGRNRMADAVAGRLDELVKDQPPL